MAAVVALVLWLVASALMSSAAVWVWRRIDPLLPPHA